MKTILAIILGKTIAALTKNFKLGGGSAAPGLYALKIQPKLVEKLVSQIPTNVVVTGTNGKTTTARILAHFAKEAGLKVIRNHTGSNLERGIASTLISHYQLSIPRLRSGQATNYQLDLGIWEMDEAAFNSVAPKIKPNVVVFLNVFRDQMDRYGEVDSVVKNWRQTLGNLSKETAVLVNGDDANTKKLAKCFKGKVLKFGVKDYKISGESIEHVKEKENLDFEAKNVKLNGLKGSSFVVSSPTTSSQLPATLPIPGLYHIYDALAAIACAYNLAFPIPKLLKSLKNFQPAFGRVEKLDFGYIFLIKNPAGATQVFETLAPQIKPQDRLLLALNDNLADGTDVSWIWDARFEELNTSSRVKSRDLEIFVSGTRAYDLANRLKYAGFDPKRITVEPNLKKALQSARKGLQGQLYILPTYTAMLELQSILARSGLKHPYWEEI